MKSPEKEGVLGVEKKSKKPKKKEKKPKEREREKKDKKVSTWGSSLAVKLELPACGLWGKAGSCEEESQPLSAGQASANSVCMCVGGGAAHAGTLCTVHSRWALTCAHYTLGGHLLCHIPGLRFFQ